MRSRSQADRDAATIEIVFAFVSGGLAAALVFAAVYVPALAFEFSPATDRTLAVAGAALAATAFLFRVTRVLWRFAHRPEREGL